MFGAGSHSRSFMQHSINPVTFNQSSLLDDFQIQPDLVTVVPGAAHPQLRMNFNQCEFSFSFSFNHCWDKLPFESASRTSNYPPEGYPWFKPIIGLCGDNSEVDSFPFIQRLEFSVEFGSAMKQVRCRSLDWGPAVLLRFSVRPELGLSFLKSISNDILQHSQYCFKCY
jgi:hypothetical protein